MCTCVCAPVGMRVVCETSTLSGAQSGQLDSQHFLGETRAKSFLKKIGTMRVG